MNLTRIIKVLSGIVLLYGLTFLSFLSEFLSWLTGKYPAYVPWLLHETIIRIILSLSAFGLLKFKRWGRILFVAIIPIYAAQVWQNVSGKHERFMFSNVFPSCWDSFWSTRDNIIEVVFLLFFIAFAIVLFTAPGNRYFGSKEGNNS